MGAELDDYQQLDRAFEFFNKNLWEGELGTYFISYGRRKGVRGTFATDSFQSREDDKYLDEIILYPATFKDRSDKEILSTLVHEMCHMWQSEWGKPSRNGYHNIEWVQEMKRVGLIPYSATTDVRGTGQKVSHSIEEGGQFDLLSDELINSGFKLSWSGVPDPVKQKTKKAKQKIKYECSCPNKVWGKPGLVIQCGECEEQMIGEEHD